MPLSNQNLQNDTVTAGVEITGFQTPGKTSDTIKDLPNILKIHRTSCLVSRVQIHPTCLPARM